MVQEKKNSIIKYKFIYTMGILLTYVLGKSLPLFGVDFSFYANKAVDAESLLIQTISGDVNQCSLFALGISPYMISSIIVQILSACRSSEAKARISPKKMNRLTLKLTLFFAVFQALIHVRELQFQDTVSMLWLTQTVAVVEMVTGAIMILWLSERNKRYGIGGQTTLIFVNIVEGMIATLSGHGWKQLAVPILASLVVMVVMIIMENTEKRIPVQRISIHNIYADKNYMAIKLNPIGVMPAMFSTAFFMLPQLLLSGLQWIFPENANILWWQENMVLSKPLGIAAYIVILFALTIGFSRVILNPSDLTEQYLKSGDSLVNLHAGRETKRYLSGTIFRISLFSALVMSICLGVPMVLQLYGGIDNTLTTLPSSVMMMTGVWCNLYREVSAIRDLEAYKPFI